MESIQSTDLGGGWFDEHMLLDLMRRFTQFELLPGSIVAQPDLGLAGWIQHRIRECLRAVDVPLTRDRVLVETPDIAAFEACIDELIAREGQLETINLSGGEPTLHPELLTLIDAARARDGIARVSISTNGLRCASDPELCHALAERGV